MELRTFGTAWSLGGFRIKSVADDFSEFSFVKQGKSPSTRIGYEAPVFIGLPRLN